MNNNFDKTSSIIYNNLLQFHNQYDTINNIFKNFIYNDINKIQDIIDINLDIYNQEFIENISSYVFHFILNKFNINNNNVHYNDILNNQLSILFNKLCIYYFNFI
jgi:Na+-driven multidrug efflux pump